MKTFIVTGLGFGDEGKGTIVDALTSLHRDDRPVVIRHNGGPQAAHNVMIKHPDHGVLHHTFAQFGSGMLNPECMTHLSKYMLVNPVNMINENKVLIDACHVTDALKRTTIAESARIITPYHVITNRARTEVLGHGSCGEGIGELMQDWLETPDDVLTYSDLSSHNIAIRKLLTWKARKRAVLEELGADTTELTDTRVADVMALYQWVYKHVQIVPDWHPTTLLNDNTVIFEGAQGVLLDEYRGFHPHTTWSTTTTHNARSLIGSMDVDLTSIGVTRTYGTRHGPGPFPTEDRQVRHPEAHNNGSGFQGKWRRGDLDLTLLDYAIEVSGGIDVLAVTHVDAHPHRVVIGYRDGNRIPPGKHGDLVYQQHLTERLYEATGKPPVNMEYLTLGAPHNIPVAIASEGPFRHQKQFFHLARK